MCRNSLHCFVLLRSLPFSQESDAGLIFLRLSIFSRIHALLHGNNFSFNLWFRIDFFSIAVALVVVSGLLISLDTGLYAIITFYSELLNVVSYSICKASVRVHILLFCTGSRVSYYSVMQIQFLKKYIQGNVKNFCLLMTYIKLCPVMHTTTGCVLVFPCDSLSHISSETWLLCQDGW